MELSEIPSKFSYLKWVSATAFGVTLGVIVYFLFPNFTYDQGSPIASILGFIFRWRYILVGISVGVAQGLVIRKHVGGFFAWVIATALGFTLAIGTGRDAFQTVFNSLTHSLVPTPSVTTMLISAELIDGILFGFTIGLAQWLVVRTTLVKFGNWIITSILAWSVGFLVEGLVVITVASSSRGNPPNLHITLEPLILGFENVLIGFEVLGVVPSFALHNKVQAIVILLITGSVVGAITGTTLVLKGSDFLNAVVLNWKRQNFVTRLCSALGVTVLISGLGLALFMVTKDFDALALSKDVYGMSIPATGGGCGRELDFQPERRVVKQNESIPIYVKIENSQAQDCPVAIKLFTTDFDYSPAEPTQAVSIPPNQTATLVWMITPKRLGTYSLGVSNGLDSRTTAVSVVNMFGLNEQQAKLLSLAGTFFGPALTFPWLLSFWQQKRENTQKQTTDEQINDLKREIENLKRKKR